MNNSGNCNQTKIKTNQNIQVYVRVRPLNSRERSIRSHEVVEVPTTKEVVVRQMFDSKTTKKFTFDRAFGPDSRQSEVYQAVVAPLIEEVLAGYNCTVFAYGQTGTGKTHTMIGTENPELKSTWEDESMIGIIPRALSHLFDELRLMEVEFSMRISYLELYNEELCDLLSSDDATKIRIFDDSSKKGSIIVQGLEEISVHSKDDVYKLLEKGKERRKTATTLMNAQSSRSHTVFSILVHIKENGIDGEEMLKIGKLNLVDLAGSENISKAGNEKGIRARETVNINQSLLTLGRVITALVERTPHIPYRESKLTRLLQESLGGRTKTSIIATISPGHKDLEETLSTLDYAHRAKNIQNKPEINQKLTKKTILREYTEEIDKLKRDLLAARDKNGIYLTEDAFVDLQYKSEKCDSQARELVEKDLHIKAMREEMGKKEKIFNEVSLHLIEKSEELKVTKNELGETKKVLIKTKRRAVEEKHLVDSHVKTEKVLTEQATKLIEVADVATSDTLQLHNTIERRKTVEVNNQTACADFVNKMENLFGDMKQQMNTLAKEHRTHSQIIIEEIGKNLSEYKKFSSDATAKIKLVSKQCIDSLNDIQSCRGKYVEQFSDANSRYNTKFSEAMNELKEKDSNHKAYLINLITEMLEFVNQTNTIATSNRAKLAERVAASNQSVTELVSQACSELAGFAEETKSSLKRKFADVLDDIGNRETRSSRRQSAVENFLAELRQIEEEDVAARKKLKVVAVSGVAESDSITQDIDSKIRIIRTIGEESTMSCENVKEIALQWETETHCSVESCTKSATVINEVLIENSDSRNEAFTNLESMTDGHVNSFDETFENFKKDSTTLEEAQKEKSATECANTMNLVSKETERVKHYQTQSGAYNKSLQKAVGEYSSQFNNSMAACVNNIQTFRDNELKTYSPTGQTPSRREFSYPRTLVATSPHASIIRRFRMEKEWSDTDTTITLAEDSELPLPDISSDDLLINSTPIKSDVEAEDSKLKDVRLNSNCQIIQSNSLDEKSQSRKNSKYDKENKENCVV